LNAITVVIERLKTRLEKDDKIATFTMWWLIDFKHVRLEKNFKVMETFSMTNRENEK